MLTFYLGGALAVSFQVMLELKRGVESPVTGVLFWPYVLITILLWPLSILGQWVAIDLMLREKGE